MSEFHRTVMGQRYYENTMPRLAGALERIASTLEEGGRNSNAVEVLLGNANKAEQLAGGFAAELPRGVRPMVDASREHLKPSDLALLEEYARAHGRTRGVLPRMVGHEYGFTLFLTGDAEGRAKEVKAVGNYGFSQGLLALIKYAHQHEAYILNLDRDAEAIPGIPVYDH